MNTELNKAAEKYAELKKEYDILQWSYDALFKKCEELAQWQAEQKQVNSADCVFVPREWIKHNIKLLELETISGNEFYKSKGRYELLNRLLDFPSEQKQDDCLCALKIPVNETERVNALLIGALRFLNEEQMIVLRDALIARTPKPEQKQVPTDEDIRQKVSVIVSSNGSGNYKRDEIMKLFKSALQYAKPSAGVWVKASELEEINYPICVKLDGGGAAFYTTVCSMGELLNLTSELNPIESILYLDQSALQYSVGDGYSEEDMKAAFDESCRMNNYDTSWDIEWKNPDFQQWLTTYKQIKTKMSNG